MSDFQRVKDKANIVEVISDYITLKRTGANHQGICPFHNEKTPSFVVFENNHNYKCFGCGESGDVFEFIEKIEGLSKSESLQFLAKKFHVEINHKQDEKTSERSSILTANTIAHKHFIEMLPGGLDYLKNERHFNSQTINEFQIGYAIDSWDELLKTLTSKGYSPDFLEKAGLLSKSKEKYFDKFRGRVIFPVISISGQIVGFSGRVTEKDKKPKYLNSPETLAFEKGKHLFGLYQAKRALQNENLAYLVEGNTDVTSFHQKNIKNTVASLGTAFTEDQAKLIIRFCEHICFIFDGDNAGKKAANRSIPIALKAGLKVQVLALNEGEDPDSIAKSIHEPELRDYLQDNSVTWSDYYIPGKDDSPEEKTNALNQIRKCLNAIENEGERAIYVEYVAEKTNLSTQEVMSGVIEIENKEEVWPLKQVKKDIEKKGELNLYTKRERASSRIASGDKNTIAINSLSFKVLKTISELKSTIYFEEEIMDENIHIPKTIAEQGIEVKVFGEGEINMDTGEVLEYISFTNFYINWLSQKTPIGHFDKKTENLEEIARHVSHFGQTTIIAATNEIPKKFGITKADFNKILKDFIDKKNSKNQFLKENISVNGENYIFEIDRLPEYVDQQFFNSYGFFPAQNKDGNKIFYVFRNKEGTGLRKIANFYMEPLFHLHAAESDHNKRVVKLNQIDGKTVKYIEIPSEKWINLQSFRGRIAAAGPFVTTGMTQYQYELIVSSIIDRFPFTYELKLYGQQDKRFDFWSWSNAILTKEGEIKHMDELGLVTVKDTTFYSPSVSKIYEDYLNKDEMFEQDQYFKLSIPDNPTSFEKWSNLVKEVYKYNDNGYWAIAMVLLSAFRSDIFPIKRFFTTLFLQGPTECGKSQIAQSIRAVFMHKDAPMFNLNSGTDAAFFTVLERYRDVPIIMEEYNDMQITDTKFQGLKAAVYDGEGKTKRKAADTKELDVSKVNGVPIILGQESPERDDGSLGNRSVKCPVKKKDNWSDIERDNFTDLKERESDGLSNILIEILKQRPKVRKHMKPILDKIQKDATKQLRDEKTMFQTRILNTVSLFLAIVKLWEEHVPEMKLPFSYNEFHEIALKKIVSQSEEISNTSRLGVFFDTLLLLSLRGKIKHGREFLIQTCDEITIREGRKEMIEKRFDKPTKLLFIRLKQVHQYYREVEGQEHLKMNNLVTYLKDHQAYIGNVKSWKFEWEEEVRDKNNESEGHTEEEKKSNNYAVSRMENRSQYSSAVVLNYEELGIDFGDYFQTKSVKDTETQSTPDPQPLQTQMQLSDDELPI